MKQNEHIARQYGQLKSVVVPGAPNGPCVVLFHGYGADAHDLAPLADFMDLGSKVTWIFPEAPLEIIVAPGFYGKAWFQIDNRRLEQSLIDGKPLDMSDRVPDGLESARKKASSLYQEVCKQHKQVVIGGFSQGAMLATELAMTEDRAPEGLVLMSGTLICESRWRELATNRAGQSFYQSHGKNDALLGYEYAEKLHELLTSSGWDGEFNTFSGGHEIPPKVIESIGDYLQSKLRV